ncbi:hypothetical protein INO08_16410, partial [Staphylococcus aureus]|nr:hypothetical protein [Staphylococcus aureus]
WANWAKEKITEGLGIKHEDDSAAKKASDAASDTLKKTKKGAQEVKDKAHEEVASDAGDAKEKAWETKEAAKDRGSKAADSI